MAKNECENVATTLVVPSAYKLTAQTAIAAVERVLTGKVANGFSTPSRAFGNEFILAIPEMELKWGNQQWSPQPADSDKPSRQQN